MELSAPPAPIASAVAAIEARFYAELLVFRLQRLVPAFDGAEL